MRVKIKSNLEGDNYIMDNKTLKGIALILFGILLGISGGEINSTVLHSFSDFPFALIGVISGVVGIIMVFSKEKKEDDR